MAQHAAARGGGGHGRAGGLGPGGGDIQQEWYGNAPRPAPLFTPYLILVYALTFLGVCNLVRFYRSPPSEAARNRTLYVLLGVSCSLLGGIFDSLPPLMTVYPVSMVGNLFFAFFTAVAILKHNLLDARLVIKKGFVYSVVSAIIVGVYVVLLFSLNLLFQHKATSVPLVGNMAAVLTAAILLKPLLDRVQYLADRWFARQCYDHLRALEAFSRETKDITDLSKLTRALEEAVTLAMGAEHVRLLVPSGNGARFVSPAERSSNGTRPFRLQASSPITEWLRSHDDILREDDLRILPEFLKLSGKERAQLEHFQVEMFIPVKYRNELAGILMLSRKRSEGHYSEEDLGLLRAVVNQTSVGLENARLFASVLFQRTRLEQLLGRVMRAQEDERKRLSMELHDSPVQWLTSVVYRLEASLELLRKGEYASTRQELEDVREALDTTLAELRRTTAGLRPPELEKVGLLKALRRHAHAFERDTSVLVNLEEIGMVPRLPISVELTAYRVVQEALSNVRKHAEATDVLIQLELDQEALNVVVRDNGVGFDVDDARRTDSGTLGLGTAWKSGPGCWAARCASGRRSEWGPRSRCGYRWSGSPTSSASPTSPAPLFKRALQERRCSNEQDSSLSGG